MKPCIKICFLGVLLFSMAEARGNSTYIFNPYYHTFINPRAISTLKHAHQPVNRSARYASLDSVTKLLRLKLYVDQYNYDDIVIGFNSGASNTYDFNEDAKYMPGLGSGEGLASYSSDGVPLSINLLPLPARQVCIRLDFEAKNSGQVLLEKTQLDQLPGTYSVWLMDSYLKDSLDLRANSNYTFSINKADTASFGSYRFCVVVRQSQTPVPPFQLADFNASKSGTEAEISWDAKNEANNTMFSVERSDDGGATFQILDTLKSTSAGRYNYTDNTPPISTDLYRLKIAFQSGTVSFSNIVMLQFKNSINTITRNINIYPNPASNVVNLAIHQAGANSVIDPVSTQDKMTTRAQATMTSKDATVYNIKIVNISGSIIKMATSATDTWQQNITGLLPGTYIITVTNNSNNKLVGRSSFVKM